MNKKLFAYAVLPVLGLTLVGTGTAYAGYGDGFGGGRGMGDGMGRHGGNGMGQGAGLVSGELREQVRNMSYEERAALRQERADLREQHRREVEDFTGLSHEEMRALRWSGQSVGDVLESKGITEAEAEAFLTKQAEERVDAIVEAHDLDSSTAETLRGRITGFVDRILERWFGN